LSKDVLEASELSQVPQSLKPCFTLKTDRVRAYFKKEATRKLFLRIV